MSKSDKEKAVENQLAAAEALNGLLSDDPTITAHVNFKFGTLDRSLGVPIKSSHPDLVAYSDHEAAPDLGRWLSDFGLEHLKVDFEKVDLQPDGTFGYTIGVDPGEPLKPIIRPNALTGPYPHTGPGPIKSLRTPKLTKEMIADIIKDTDGRSLRPHVPSFEAHDYHRLETPSVKIGRPWPSEQWPSRMHRHDHKVNAPVQVQVNLDKIWDKYSVQKFGTQCMVLWLRKVNTEAPGAVYDAHTLTTIGLDGEPPLSDLEP